MKPYVPPIRAITVGYNKAEAKPPFTGFRYSIPADFTATGKMQTKQESFGAIFGKGTVAATLREAEKMIAQWHAAREAQTDILDVPTVEEMCQLFVDEDPEIRAGKGAAAYYVIKRILKWFKPNTLASELTTVGLASMVRGRLARGDAPTSVRKDLQYVIGMLHCVAKRLPPEFVMPDVKSMRRKQALPDCEARTGHLNAEDEERVFEIAAGVVLSLGSTADLGKKHNKPRAGRIVTGDYRAALAICLILETASRGGAVDKLLWSQIDLGQGTITFNAPGRVKNNKRRVDQPISDRLYPVLVHAFKHRISENVLLNDSTTEHAVPNFLAKYGYQVTRHDMRRTWAILNLLAGMPVADVAGWLGDSIATVEKHYAHWLPGKAHLSRVANFRQAQRAKVVPLKRGAAA